MSEPVWSEDRIITEISNHPKVFAAAVMMRNDYEARIDELEKRIAYYEKPNPDATGACAHKFNDDGICIRCNEDAENWDAGCVEEMWTENDAAHKRIAELEQQLAEARGE